MRMPGRASVSAFPRCLGPCGGLFGPNCASGARVTDKMVPPVQVSPLIKVNQAPQPPPLIGPAWAKRVSVSVGLEAPARRPRLSAPPALTRRLRPPHRAPTPRLGRYSALFLGMAYGAKRYNYLKPRAEEERRLAAEEKKKRDEQKRIERELAEAQEDTILK
ncbi:ATP synthase subunit e, mitochondrial isoform X1 [Cervus canadensis]|uniref:ATP synthase subunit e, mitochondrial isoform X1 n=1 Tax=Cervus canadensis TaxID=1574408 RepID=UPI001CA32F3C|nr:ATP synthase subunit e, mitochondrial isoform X1 [Cervus canadensis]